MSNWGINRYVIEGINGKNFYEKIMDSVEKCIEFNKSYKIDKVEGYTYTIEKSTGNSDDIVQYDIAVWEGDQVGGHKDLIVWSWFYLSDVKFENECLFISERSCLNWGGIQKYITDTKMYESGFYYYLDSDWYVHNFTNDKDGKYFQRNCVITGVDSEELHELSKDRDQKIKNLYPENFDELDSEMKRKIWDEEDMIHEDFLNLYTEIQEKLIPTDFDEWSYEKKLSYCEFHSDNIMFKYTKLREFERL